MAKQAKQAKRNIFSIPSTLKKVCEQYIEAEEKKRSAARETRKADAEVKNAYATISDAMGGEILASCDNFIIQRVTYPAVDGSLKLKNGEEVKLSGIKSLTLADGKKIPFEEVESIYGGRSAGHKLSIKG